MASYKAIAKVKDVRIHGNGYRLSQDLILKISFWDRLKFLVYGKDCLIEIPNELLIK